MALELQGVVAHHRVRIWEQGAKEISLGLLSATSHLLSPCKKRPRRFPNGPARPERRGRLENGACNLRFPKCPFFSGLRQLSRVLCPKKLHRQSQGLHL